MTRAERLGLESASTNESLENEGPRQTFPRAVGDESLQSIAISLKRIADHFCPDASGFSPADHNLGDVLKDRFAELAREIRQ